MSFASTHSHRSSRSKEEKKLDLIESPGDKKKLHGKSDPTKALKEAQPGKPASAEQMTTRTDRSQLLSLNLRNQASAPSKAMCTRIVKAIL